MNAEAHWTDEDYRPIDPQQQSWDNGVDLYSMEVPEMEHGFHGSSRNLEGTTIKALVDRPGASDAGMWDESSPHFVNYWTPNPLARIYRDGLADPENDPGATPKELRRDAEEEAWVWARHSSQNTGMRPRVYEGSAVTGMDRPVGLDPNLPEDINMGVHHILPMAAGAFEVSDTHWIPPGLPGRAVQGTLPHVNWNQFKAPNVGNPENVPESLLGVGDIKYRVARQAQQDQEAKAARPFYGPARPSLARYRARRAEAAGQMRLPGL